MWRLKKLNAQLANPKLNTENDSEEYGKGHEFATQTFPDPAIRSTESGGRWIDGTAEGRRSRCGERGSPNGCAFFSHRRGEWGR
jgi:hypothetical protein